VRAALPGKTDDAAAEGARGKTVAIDDLIRGHVEWQSDLIGDPVILRGDGRALYNFATVVDDVAMKITHIVRASEHLSNTATQSGV